MTTTHEDSTGEATDQRTRNHRPAWRFVGIFVVLVLLQLTVYRYGVNSWLNDVYLFNVARHTRWVLNTLGDSATMEKFSPPVAPEEARRIIAGMERKTNRPSVSDPAPLSAWERWRYRALTSRQSLRGPEELGPKVSFVLRPGIHHRLRALERERQAAQTRVPPDGAQLKTLDGRIGALRDELTAGLKDPVIRQQQAGQHFTFQVIPSCGAIEIGAIFLAAVIAFSAPWRSRAWGLLLGLPILYLVNIARLVCLAVIGALDREGHWFNFVHEYVWQSVYVVFVVVLWLVWVELALRRQTR